MTTTLEIDSADIIRVILQFLKENNLSDSCKALSNESDITLNTVDNLETFVSDLHNGRWDAVLMQVNNIKIPKDKLYALYEQIIFELLENGERELAKEMLKNTEPLKGLKNDQPERFLKLEHLCKRPFFNSTDAYDMGVTKEKRRQEIADSLICEVSVVPPSRLLALLNQSLRYQQMEGLIPKGGSFDLFKGGRKSAVKDNEEKFPKRLAGQMRFPVDSHAETLAFSPDGLNLLTGSIDGFLEVWDHETLKLRKDLEYQAKEELMMHEEAVLCSAFSRDGKIQAFVIYIILTTENY
jgi:WD40 repeat-containing protein SMU1